LPFRDAIFDCVFHVGGINFFSDKARAIAEMVRVARPGTKIVIVDETEKVVSEMYRKIPVTRSYFADRDEAVSCPIDLVPGQASGPVIPPLIESRRWLKWVHGEIGRRRLPPWESGATGAAN
jgi:SAM-dependent methyltransferase